MNLLHLTSSRFFGGPERQMLELAREMAGAARTTFASFAEGGGCREFLDHARAEGFEAIMLRHDTPRLWAATREITAELNRCHIDVIVSHGYKSNLTGLFAARRLGIPIVSVSHGWTGENARVRLYEALDRRLLRYMDEVVCVSRGQAAKVRRTGVSEAKIKVIWCAIRPERFAVPKPEYRDRLLAMFPAPPNRIIGAAGRLSPEKGFDLLVDAAAEVLHTNPDAGFVLFGEGVLRGKLERQIFDLGLADRFILAGFHDDLDRFLPHLDLFVQSSHAEGLPNVILEAIACNVPVVATAVGGTPEIIDNEVHGLLVPPGDTHSLVKSIFDLLGNPKKGRRMAASGSRKVIDMFSFDAQARSYNGVLRNLLPTDTTGVQKS